MTKTKSLRIFLCHAKEDKTIVRNLHKRLKNDGFDVWLDEVDLIVGQEWELEIPKAVKASDIVLVLLSNNSVTKTGYVQKEIRIALDVADYQPEGAIFLIPARLEDCKVPDRISRFQWVDLFEKDGYIKLTRALNMKAEFLNIVKSKPGYKINPYTTFDSSILTTLMMYGDVAFIQIPKGDFILGSNNDDHDYPRWPHAPSEQPRQNINIPYDYFISRYLITNENFEFFADSTGYRTLAEEIGGVLYDNSDTMKIVPGINWRNPISRQKSCIPSHPVVQVTDNDAVEYAQWLTEIFKEYLPDDTIFRLPTEAEWEKAARGENGNIWPWGNVFESSYCNNKGLMLKTTTPVGHFSPKGDSIYGVADMAGNVNEWTSSKYVEYPYPKFGETKEPEFGGKGCVARGGSYLDDDWHVRCARRQPIIDNARGDNFGFRLVLAPKVGI
jgi:formylglycine-generating enzyme required for sulfatase activity